MASVASRGSLCRKIDKFKGIWRFLEEVVCETNKKESIGISPFCLPSGDRQAQPQVDTGRKQEREGGQKLACPSPSVLDVVPSRGCISFDPVPMSFSPWPSSCWVPVPATCLWIPSSCLSLQFQGSESFLLWVISTLLSVPYLWAQLLNLPSVKAVCCIIFPLLEIPKVLFVYLTGPCLMQNPRLSNWHIVFKNCIEKNLSRPGSYGGA